MGHAPGIAPATAFSVATASASVWMSRPTIGAASAIFFATARRSASAPAPFAAFIEPSHTSAWAMKSPRPSRTMTAATVASDT